MKVEFNEIGKGFFVEIKDPKRMSWKEQKNITKAFKDETIASQLDVAEMIAISVIKSGYVLDADDKPLAFPLTVETVEDVPAAIIEKVAETFAELKGANTGKN